MQKHITFIINYFYPDLASTGQLMTDLCTELQNDFEITVIAAQPNYAGENVSSKPLFEKDKLENMDVIRIRLPEVNKNSKLSRLKYILAYFFLALIALLKVKKLNAIYTISQPPVLGGLIGTLGKFFKRSKHIYNIQDFNPEQAAAISYSSGFLVKLAKSIDKMNCKLSDQVIVVGNDMAETLKGRFKNCNVPDHTVINNWTDDKNIIPLDKEEQQIKEFVETYNLRNKTVIMYSGNIGLFYDLENIIKITTDYKDNENLVFLFIGEGAMKSHIKEFVAKNNIRNVLFLPYQPKDFIKYSLNVADIHLVVNQKGIKGVSVPSKIYGVMAAGKPILGVLEDGSEASNLINESNCGVVVEPQNYDGIKKEIDRFLDLSEVERIALGENGRKYLEQHLRKEVSINKYRDTLKSVLET
ncbi:glycosyltransferase family 4 protein [Tuberibacillus sp. Marseille-P3662]|uniref:glycosyltransferase family 4 protein n=1 Tax=Tuberibacillus sp. Marseille-P3662 TaxID=1965358 RepID=UPI000A1C7EDD|nr:glycosyltransferase family 4 protein [Tuberibacillus sp. Marseille-P3662]